MRSAPRPIAFSTVCLCLAWATLMTSHAAARDASAPQNASIRKADMKADMLFLTSDRLNGRENGTRDTDIAAEFIKARLERIGLDGAGPGGAFFQPFNLMSATLGTDNRFEVVMDGGSSMHFHPGQDYYPLRFSASGVARGPVVFAGFGIRPADYGSSVKGADRPRPRSRAGRVRSAESVRRARPFRGVEPRSARPSLPRKRGPSASFSSRTSTTIRDSHDFESAAKDYWPDRPGGLRLSASASRNG